MTSLDGPGFSITLLKATSEILTYIDTPVTALGWSAPSFSPSVWKSEAHAVAPLADEGMNGKPTGTSNIKCKYFTAQAAFE
jgi:dihydroxyacetone kinase